jgi:hypothetical protein
VECFSQAIVHVQCLCLIWVGVRLGNSQRSIVCPCCDVRLRGGEVRQGCTVWLIDGNDIRVAKEDVAQD